jgi:hypothetical protein
LRVTFPTASLAPPTILAELASRALLSTTAVRVAVVIFVTLLTASPASDPTNAVSVMPDTSSAVQLVSPAQAPTAPTAPLLQLALAARLVTS